MTDKMRILPSQYGYCSKTHDTCHITSTSFHGYCAACWKKLVPMSKVERQ